MRPVLVAASLLSLSVVAAVSGSAHGAESTFRKVVFARGFDHPVLVTHAPGEPRALYVLEQPGRVIRFQGGRRTVFLDIRRQVQYLGEQGLLGLAFDPRYTGNRRFYVAYTSKSGHNIVARYRSDGRRAVVSSRTFLLRERDPYGNHNGGNLVIGPDGRLYTSIGDGGYGGDPQNRAQNMKSPFGKLLAFDVSVEKPTWTIAGLGLRNPWRFSFDRATGDLYIGDVGQETIEEVNFTSGSSTGLENYGWDIFEGSTRYQHGDSTLKQGVLVFPVFEYRHAKGGPCSVTGGFVYRGRARPELRGRYVFGDYCAGMLWSFRVESGAAVDLRTEPFQIVGLTSFGEDAAGEIYAMAYTGIIYRLTSP